MTRIGLLGTGDVAKALGTGFITLGHEVRMGSRSATNDKALAWAKAAGGKATVGTFADAAAFGEIVVLATLASANASALQMAGPERLRTKIVIDTTNPLDASGGMAGIRLALSGNDSAGEQVQRLLPGARVVKAFNTVGHALMFRPTLPGGPPDMFIAGDDDAAKQEVTKLLTSFGWGTVDVGGIDGARFLEAMCPIWIRHGAITNTWAHAFKMLHA